MRRAKHVALTLVRALGGFAVARWVVGRSSVRILCYHGAWLGDDAFGGDSMFIRPETFRRRLELLRHGKYNVLTLDEAVAGLRGDTALPPRATVITIDDGWYSTYAAMLPALGEYGFPATLYCDTQHLQAGIPVPHLMARYFRLVAGRAHALAEVEALRARALDLSLPESERLPIALEYGRRLGLDTERYLNRRVFDYMTPSELRAFAAEPGMSIELHTHRHTLGDHGAEVVQRELADNRAALGELLMRPPERFTHFCYPSGDFAASDVAVFRDSGITSATTTQRGLATRHSEPYLLPRILDGDDVSEPELLALLSGLVHLVRSTTRRQLTGYDRPLS